MAREYMCESGDCQETEGLFLTVTDAEQGRRIRFCSYGHLEQWAHRQWEIQTINEARAERPA